MHTPPATYIDIVCALNIAAAEVATPPITSSAVATSKNGKSSFMITVVSSESSVSTVFVDCCEIKGVVRLPGPFSTSATLSVASSTKMPIVGRDLSGEILRRLLSVLGLLYLRTRVIIIRHGLPRSLHAIIDRHDVDDVDVDDVDVDDVDDVDYPIRRETFILIPTYIWIESLFLNGALST